MAKTTAKQEQKHEHAIRTYMRLIKEPEALIDAERIQELNTHLNDAHDPVERVKIRSEVERERTPDIDHIESEFVTHAKPWATKHGIDPQAFIAEGVDPTLLKRAGFKIHPSQTQASHRRAVVQAHRQGRKRMNATSKNKNRSQT